MSANGKSEDVGIDSPRRRSRTSICMRDTAFLLGVSRWKVRRVKSALLRPKGGCDWEMEEVKWACHRAAVQHQQMHRQVPP